MSRETFKDFQSKYPNLFREYPRSGFYAATGWLPLLHNLCAVLEHHITNLPDEVRPHVQCAQVKEKFGTLRFYMTQETPFISGAIAMAESMTGCLCEECGGLGERRSGGWIRVLCDKHHEENQKHREEERKKWIEENPGEDPDEYFND